MLSMPVAMRLKRLARKVSKSDRFAGEKHACLIVRQRVVSNMSGSSAYLLSLYQALRGRVLPPCRRHRRSARPS